MKLTIVIAFLIGLCLLSNYVQQSQAGHIQDQYQKIADLIMATAMQNTNITKLHYLCDKFGNRFAGSQHLKDATAWIVDTMNNKENLTAKTEEIEFNQWFRGAESAKMVVPYEKPFSILGLGNTISSNGPIRGKVIVVSSFDELTARADEAVGNIVLYNVPFVTYGATVQYRSKGAIEAAKVGAIAACVRSIASYSLYTPHTGSTHYDDSVPKIPFFAVTVEDAELMGRLASYGEEVEIEFDIDSYRQDATGSNILATISGWQSPDQISAFGGHIDSWDVGNGCNDDAGGFFSTWEAVKLLNDLISIQHIPVPRRSIRSIGWLNEENGSDGANYYYKNHLEIEDHILVGESDNGNFKPIDFGFSGGSTAGFKAFSEVVGLLSQFNITATYGTGSTTDNTMWCSEETPCSSLHSSGMSSGDQTYFWYHHSNADTPDKMIDDGVRQSVAAIAVVLYVTADMPDSLNAL